MSLAAMSPGSSTSHSEEDGLDAPDAPDDPKKKKFSKLKKNVKSFFKFGGKKGKTKEESMVRVGSIKATSSPNVAEDEAEEDIEKPDEEPEDGGQQLSSTYSKSHESVFNNTDKALFGAELNKVLGKKVKKCGDDEFSGGESPHLLSVDSYNKPSYSSEHSLASMGDSMGSENELDEVFGITRKTTKSPCSDTDLDFIKSTSSLNNEAIKHRISVAPKHKRRPQSTFKPGRGASPRPAPSPLTLVTEESPKNSTSVEEDKPDEGPMSPPELSTSPPSLTVPVTKPIQIPRPKLKSASSIEELEQIQKNASPSKPEPQKRPAHLVVTSRSPHSSPSTATSSSPSVDDRMRTESPQTKREDSINSQKSVESSRKVESPTLATRPDSPKKLESPQSVSIIKKSPLPDKSKSVRVGSPVKSPDSPAEPEFAKFLLRSRPKEIVTVTKSPEPDDTSKINPEKDTGKVVLRRTSVDRDVNKRQTVHVDTNLVSPTKGESLPNKRNSLTDARNWEEFPPKASSPQSNTTTPDSGESEFASMFNRIKRKSSLKHQSPEKKVVNIDVSEKPSQNPTTEVKKTEQKEETVITTTVTKKVITKSVSEKVVPKPVSENVPKPVPEKVVPKPIIEKIVSKTVVEKVETTPQRHSKINMSKSLDERSTVNKTPERSQTFRQSPTKSVTVENKRHLSDSGSGSTNKTVVIENKQDKPKQAESILKPATNITNKPSAVKTIEITSEKQTVKGTVIIEKKSPEKKTTFSNNVKNKEGVDENDSVSSKFKSRPRSSTLPDSMATAKALESIDSSGTSDAKRVGSESGNSDKQSPAKTDASPKRAASVLIKPTKTPEVTRPGGNSTGPQDWREMAKRKTQLWQKDNTTESEESKEKKDSANSAMKKEGNDKTESKTPSPEAESDRAAKAKSVRNMVAMWGK